MEISTSSVALRAMVFRALQQSSALIVQCLYRVAKMQTLCFCYMGSLWEGVFAGFVDGGW